ncbi:Protein R01E6.2 [Aphelenchoides avenae]|nr:Protein R01E6.2 [Aphelenchus avenae]
MLALSIAALLATTASAQYYGSATMGGTVGCVVTGKQFYSHGNYIRDLRHEEEAELERYKKQMDEFRKKISEAFANAEVNAQTNTTLPPMPVRPAMPSFCSSNETTLYILGGCAIQNHKVYVGGKYARTLTDQEKVQLERFAKQMSANTYVATTNDNNAQNTTSTATNSTSSAADEPQNDVAQPITLDFCMEF